MFEAVLQPGVFQIHSNHIHHWKIVILMLSVTSMKSKVTMAQDSGCLYIIPMPPPLPNFMDFVIHHQDNKVASLKEGGTKDNALTRAIKTIEKNCDCNATSTNMRTVNLIRECPKTLSASWSLDYSHCKTETTPVLTSSTRPTIAKTSIKTTPKSYETTLTTSKYVTPPSVSTTNSSLPGIGEVHTADADHNSIIIAATVIPLVVLLGMAAFIIYKYKNRGWCTDFSLKPTKRCYQKRDSAPPPSQTGTNGKLPSTFPSEGTENLGMETAESPVSIIPLENRFSTFGRPKSQAVSEYSASISLEDQSPDHVPIRNGTNNNRKPRSLYLDLGTLGRPGDDDIPYMDQCPTPSPNPTPTSPSAGFNAGFSRGISRVELI